VFQIIKDKSKVVKIEESIKLFYKKITRNIDYKSGMFADESDNIKMKINLSNNGG
jgi:hypothetical protein